MRTLEVGALISLSQTSTNCGWYTALNIEGTKRVGLSVHDAASNTLDDATEGIHFFFISEAQRLPRFSGVDVLAAQHVATLYFVCVRLFEKRKDWRPSYGPN